MKSPNYYRVRFAVRVLFWGSLVAGLLWVAGSVWWTGSGYCFGSMVECVPIGGE
jgi:hypothetical protein